MYVYRIQPADRPSIRFVAEGRTKSSFDRNSTTRRWDYDPRWEYRPNDPLAIDEVGATGELAVARYTNLPWHSLLKNLRPGGRKPPDVGDDIQVRATTRSDGCLIIHPKNEDAPDERYVLTIVKPDRVLLVGWIYGVVGQNQDFWADKGNGRPAFFIPQKALLPIDTLDRPAAFDQFVFLPEMVS